MPDWIHGLACAAHRTGFGWRARREIASLRKAGGSAERRLADALDASLRTPSGTAEEAGWMQRIEALRATLQDEDAEVSFCDYGAGTRRTAARARGAGPAPRVTRTLREVCRASVPPHEARVLFHLIRRFRPASCLELGTGLGLSAAYQAAALACNASGRLVTLEGGAALARLAADHWDRLALRNVEVVTGRFQDTLSGVLEACGPIDYAFIDGHHDPAATRDYYRQLAPHLTEEAVLVFDDLRWSAGMRSAWRAVTADGRIRVAADLLAFGICFYARQPVP